MCGIFGCVLSPADLAIYNENDNHRWCIPNAMRVLGLDMMARGRDATGMVTMNDGRWRLRKAATDARTFFDQRKGIGLGANLILGHTRAKTQGHESNQLNNHPIEYGSKIGVHNGMVYNDDDLFRKNKWPRLAEVDSEAIFAALHHGASPVDALEAIEGWMAIAWIDKMDPNRLWLAKGASSPLFVAYTKGGSLFFASTSDALLKLERMHLIPDVSFASVTEVKDEGTVFSYDPSAADPVGMLTMDKFTVSRPFIQYAYSSHHQPYYSGWNYDVDGAKFRKAVGNLPTADDMPLDTLARNADDLRDPFDDEDRRAWDPPRRSPGERVARSNGMIGSVTYVDEAAGQCLVEWDPSVEDFTDLYDVTPTDEVESAETIVQFVNPQLTSA